MDKFLKIVVLQEVLGETYYIQGMESLSCAMLTHNASFLRKDLMKRYSFRNLLNEKWVFNYRPSKARQVLETVFGIMANRFGIFLSPMEITDFVLHIFLLRELPLRYAPSGSLTLTIFSLDKLFPEVGILMGPTKVCIH